MTKQRFVRENSQGIKPAINCTAFVIASCRPGVALRDKIGLKARLLEALQYAFITGSR